MNVDHARELKTAVLKNLTATFSLDAEVRALGIRAQESAPGQDALRTLAVGITQKGKQHRLAIRLQRRLLQDHPLLEQIRNQAKGEVDVRYVGRIQKLESPSRLQRRRRPLVIGCSIGHFKVTAGTLGCFVRDRHSGDTLILSNNHVLANENRAKPGDRILQPGTFDNGDDSADAIGQLRAFVRLKKRGLNRVDAAVASIQDGIGFDSRKLGSFGKLAGLGPEFVADGTDVRKVGRTTGETHGLVTAFELDNVVVGYDIGNLRFDDQIEIEGEEQSFSDGGDSGSLIFDGERRAVAILFAGADRGGGNGLGLTYGSPIRTVLDALNVDLVAE
jgi:hypothetical protein